MAYILHYTKLKERNETQGKMSCEGEKKAHAHIWWMENVEVNHTAHKFGRYVCCLAMNEWMNAAEEKNRIRNNDNKEKTVGSMRWRYFSFGHQSYGIALTRTHTIARVCLCMCAKIIAHEYIVDTGTVQAQFGHDARVKLLQCTLRNGGPLQRKHTAWAPCQVISYTMKGLNE